MNPCEMIVTQTLQDSIDACIETPAPLCVSSEGDVNISLELVPPPYLNVCLTPDPQVILVSLNTAVAPFQGPDRWENFSQGTPKQVTVTDASTPLLTQNANRLFARICNNSSQTIYMQYGINAVWKHGVPIMPNGVYIIDTKELFTGQVNAIAQTGSVLIDVTEGIV